MTRTYTKVWAFEKASRAMDWWIFLRRTRAKIIRIGLAGKGTFHCTRPWSTRRRELGARFSDAIA